MNLWHSSFKLIRYSTSLSGRRSRSFILFYFIRIYFIIFIIYIFYFLPPNKFSTCHCCRHWWACWTRVRIQWTTCACWPTRGPVHCSANESRSFAFRTCSVWSWPSCNYWESSSRPASTRATCIQMSRSSRSTIWIPCCPCSHSESLSCWWVWACWRTSRVSDRAVRRCRTRPAN